MKRCISPLIAVTLGVVVWMPTNSWAQVNSGSNGSDGVLNPTTSININMGDHPNGIYQYTSVNIPSGVTVTFIPNSNNSPVTWLVQNSCIISGEVWLLGQPGQGAQVNNNTQGGQGGPGGWSGGNGGVAVTSGQGPGGGLAGTANEGFGANASYGTLGAINDGGISSGPTYGNIYLIPLIGGSGGGGSTIDIYYGVGGGGGGGAILIAASGSIQVNGAVRANGGSSGGSHGNNGSPAGGGSGGAIRLVASQITGSGWIFTDAGRGSGNYGNGANAGQGRVRFDSYQNSFSGQISGLFSQGSQFVIVPSAGQLPQLTVTSVGGVPVSASPTGAISTPDAVVSAQQGNPIPIVVSCANLPMNTQITVSVKPMNGSPVSAMGYNTTGTAASSTATISINMPRGGGLIYATAATTP